jgi:DNA-binding transcriptional regulator YiaG
MNIKQVRNKLELSNHQLADKLGVSVKSVEAYISGQRSIDRAGIAVKRNWQKLIKAAK